MGATTPPDRRRSLFLFSFFLFSFFFFSLFYRVRATNFRPISISLHPRVRVFEFRIDSLSSSTLLDVDRDNKARLIGSYNRTDRCSLSHFIFIYIYSSRVDHGEIRACKFLLVEKMKRTIKENEPNCFRWILAIPSGKSKRNSKHDTQRWRIFNKRDLRIAVDPAVRISAYAAPLSFPYTRSQNFTVQSTILQS